MHVFGGLGTVSAWPLLGFVVFFYACANVIKIGVLGAAGRGWVDFVASGRLRLAFDWRSCSTFAAFLEGRAMDFLHREHVFRYFANTCVKSIHSMAACGSQSWLWEGFVAGMGLGGSVLGEVCLVKQPGVFL